VKLREVGSISRPLAAAVFGNYLFCKEVGLIKEAPPKMVLARYLLVSRLLSLKGLLTVISIKFILSL